MSCAGPRRDGFLTQQRLALGPAVFVSTRRKAKKSHLEQGGQTGITQNLFAVRYFQRAWKNYSQTLTGYEINFSYAGHSVRLFETASQ